MKKLINTSVFTLGAAISMVASAQHIGDLAGLSSGNDASLNESVPVAILAECELLAAFQTIQGFAPGCIGNTDILCAPSVTSAELRSILGGANGTQISTGGGTLVSAIGASPATGLNGATGAGLPASCAGSSSNMFTATVRRAITPGVHNALAAFTGSTVGTSPQCGPNTMGTVIQSASVAALQAAMNFQFATLGFTPVTDLDDMDDTVGFFKLDGIAPDLVEHVKGNYNLVANVNGVSGVASVNTRGITAGVGSLAGDGALTYTGQVFGSGAPTACGFTQVTTPSSVGGPISGNTN